MTKARQIARDALLIAAKDLGARQLGAGCAVLGAALVAAAFLCAYSGVESFLMPSEVVWIVFPLSLGAVAAVPAGSRIVDDERHSHMFDVLLAAGVSPLSIALGKAAKPFTWGIVVGIASLAAAQVGFLLGDSATTLPALSPAFLACLALIPLSASLLLVGLSLSFRNESVYAAATLCITLAPVLAACNAYGPLGLPDPAATLPAAALANLLIAAAGILISRANLSPKSHAKATRP